MICLRLSSPQSLVHYWNCPNAVFQSQAEVGIFQWKFRTSKLKALTKTKNMTDRDKLMFLCQVLAHLIDLHTYFSVALFGPAMCSFLFLCFFHSSFSRSVKTWETTPDGLISQVKVIQLGRKNICNLYNLHLLLQKNEDYLTGRCVALSWPVSGCFISEWTEDRSRRWGGNGSSDQRWEAAQTSETRLDVEPVFPAGGVHRQWAPVHWQGKSCATASQFLVTMNADTVHYNK